jgi:hypothetical protein
MSRATTSIVYDGPALRDGAMDVRDLAPALLAVGQLFDAVNSVLNGDSARVRVQVTAHETGSFQIGLEVVQTLEEHLVALLTRRDVLAASVLVTFVFGTPAQNGLMWVIKKCRGKTPTKIERLSDSTVKLVIDGETFEAPVQLLRIYQDVAVRAAAQKLIEEPLSKEGIDIFEIREQKQSVLRVEKKEAQFFARPAIPDETLVDEVRRSAYSIISLAFKEDNKWRLNDGNNAISASISDEEFLQKVDSNQISFSKGDILLCDVKVIQKQTDQGLKTEYTVIRVLEHRPAVRQLPLPFGGIVGPQSSAT